MSTVQLFIKRHTLIAFFLLAYALTWLGAIPYWLGIFDAPMLTLLAKSARPPQAASWRLVK